MDCSAPQQARCRNDHIDACGDQLGDKRRKAIVVSFGPTVFDDDIPALDIAEIG